ncbi:hypothetical protein BBL80_18130 [Vibrio parahaemolyticus]|uniref:DUF2513 domain-containing protein n=2 Tax=Vibrio harveyi group TaxID=717610 RepID=UPI00084A86BA|nr:DUF2513 domain-containing protein [Vibrio campbellii]ODW10590.1 hypothetical protein BBL80_18130 [Vibrio parahaemolyticus]PQJ37202.1 hypothetical protein BTO00_23840 [Vibrio campbellii]
MKRDMSLIREILFSIEEHDKVLPVEGFSSEVIEYHVNLLTEAQLVERSAFGIDFSFVTVTRLTWKGHEFLDSIREEQVWNTIKSEFKEAGVSTIVKVGRELAEGFAKKKVEAILGS